MHGCADELARLVRIAQADRVVLVGDLFTKGPAPIEVWQQVVEGGFEATLGNHDARLISPRDGDRGALRMAQTMDRDAPGWRAWTEGLPLFLNAGAYCVVHAGLHPTLGRAATTAQMAIRMRRFPVDDPKAPFWWQSYSAPDRVIFGHDARRGLVRVERHGQPWLIGLDSGCVYGGALSGYLVEVDRLLQVPARKVYRVPG